jgi:uncharacterized protein YjbI with pentapeptide repeats
MYRARRAPALPELPRDLDQQEVTALDHDASFEEVELREGSFSGQHASGVRFQTVALSAVDASGAQLERLRLGDCELQDCNLANVTAPRAEISSVRIVRSRLTGFRVAEGELRDVTIQDCRVDLASFGFSRLDRVTFED